MDITVRYFASLRERMGCSEQRVSIDVDEVTVADLWKQVSGDEALPDSILVAVNMEYTDSAQPLRQSDEVAFFPPVTGG